MLWKLVTLLLLLATQLHAETNDSGNSTVTVIKRDNVVDLLLGGAVGHDVNSSATNETTKAKPTDMAADAVQEQPKKTNTSSSSGEIEKKTEKHAVEEQQPNEEPDANTEGGGYLRLVITVLLSVVVVLLLLALFVGGCLVGEYTQLQAQLSTLQPP